MVFAVSFGGGVGAAPTPRPNPAKADPAFTAWLSEFRQEALSQGISAATYDRALSGITPDPRVIDADGNQPEFVRPVWEYLGSAISDTRVANGLEKLRDYRSLLARLEQRYGVEKEVLVAIWGLETGYGSFMGTHKVPRALATLAYDGRREKFGREQLIAALQILDRGDIAPENMLGSWAGAMGHTQFIPTTYNVHAVDFNGDGRRDIWNTIGDALGSAGNYLAASGWRTGADWGQEVRLPDGFDYALADRAVRKPMRAWSDLGIRGVDGSALAGSDEATLILPAGYRGPAFLVQQNFRTVLRYNNSTSYSLAVNLLADRFRGAGQIQASWPTDDRPLGRSERQELQRLLTRKGYDTGGVDGIIGGNTRAALRAWQVAQGLPADGYPTAALLARLRR